MISDLLSRFPKIPRDSSDLMEGRVRFEIYSIEQLTPLSNIAPELNDSGRRDRVRYILPRPSREQGSSAISRQKPIRWFDPHFAQCRELLVFVSSPSWD